MTDQVVSDVQVREATHEMLSGMSQAGNKLVHNVQSVRSPEEHYKFFQSIPFSDPGFGKKNTVQIPATNMNVEKILVEFQLAAATGQTDASLAPTATWLKDSGVDLLYNNNQLYNQSEPETLMYSQFIYSPEERVKMDQLTNNVPIADRRVTADLVKPLYLDLKPIADKILSKAGPLTAYASQKWSINVNLKALNQIASASSTTTAIACTISQMNLILVGHKSRGEEAKRVADKLSTDGLVIYFDDSTRIKDSTGIAAAATSKDVTVSSLEGNVSDIWYMRRVAAGINATTPNAVNTTNFQLFPLTGDTVNVGTVSNPSFLFGQPMVESLVKHYLANGSYQGGAKTLYAQAWTQGSGTGSECDMVAINISNMGQIDQTMGTSSGYWFIRNDLKISWAFATSISLDMQLDYIIFVKKQLTLTAGEAVINNSN